MEAEREHVISKASITGSSSSAAKLDKCLASQQRHALLPSEDARTNM
jgi:hypothetical protein